MKFGHVTCHVCDGTGKSPYGTWDCLCCGGDGMLTAERRDLLRGIAAGIRASCAERGAVLIDEPSNEETPA